ncbi:MAG: hypothetical protein FJ135_07210 [Deltaproteobacteria bacterium]|nr:hypothetical protein [Deltaproteobacteria bacterium]
MRARGIQVHQQRKKSRRYQTTAVLLIITMALLLAGCGKPPTVTNRYLLEYPAPAIAGQTPLQESIRVELFSAAQSINSTAMIYFPRPYETSSYVYNRWMVSPSHMVTDFLLRDLRNSGLFKGVFGHQQSGLGRFKVEGAVQQFAEINDPDGWKAVLALTVTLLDLSRDEVTQRVIWQKNYHQEEYMPEQTAFGLAQGMSQAMARVSHQVISDLYQAAARVSR